MIPATRGHVRHCLADGRHGSRDDLGVPGPEPLAYAAESASTAATNRGRLGMRVAVGGRVACRRARQPACRRRRHRDHLDLQQADSETREHRTPGSPRWTSDPLGPSIPAVHPVAATPASDSVSSPTDPRLGSPGATAASRGAAAAERSGRADRSTGSPRALGRACSPQDARDVCRRPKAGRTRRERRPETRSTGGANGSGGRRRVRGPPARDRGLVAGRTHY